MVASLTLNGATPQVTAARADGPMAADSTTSLVLADGTVQVIGGDSSSGARKYVDLDNGVYPAELWNPATGRWQTLAAMQMWSGQYHSTALLLPDVLSAFFRWWHLRHL